MHPICHILIGVPASGKSTFAKQWQQAEPNCAIVSTDNIRAKLFGSEEIQGNWPAVEAEVLTQVKQAILSGHSVIYDATNARRPWRMDMLQKLANLGVKTFVGWYIDTPLQECLIRNSTRQRQVNQNIIISMVQSLKDFEPIAAEGFAKVIRVKITDGKFDFPAIASEIDKIPRTVTNRRNRNVDKTLHQYSHLRDFERLMYLIALLSRFPGAGLLHVTNPEFLQQLVNSQEITDSLTEIAALMARQYHPIYADATALVGDLEFLEKNSIIGDQNLDAEINVSEYTGDNKNLEVHTYSDLEIFVRLIQTIRCMVHYPCFRYEEDKKSLELLWLSLKSHGYFFSLGTLRKDIQQVLHPYKILPHPTMKRAYYVGTAILAKHELAEVFNVLRSHVKDLEDPIALSTYTALEKKLELSQLFNPEQFSDSYPVRAIANQPIVDINALPDYTAYKKLDEITDAIVSGTALELNRVVGSAKFEGDPHLNDSFSVFPLQIVFNNIGWYLGYECKGDTNANLFKFERLDRIFISQVLNETRTPTAQKQALSKLETLYKSSYSLFLGNSVEDQQNYLDSKRRSQAEIVLEIWCNDTIFRFIREGTKRFAANKIKMSKQGAGKNPNSQIFALPKTKDPIFPNRLQVNLPCWSVGDIDLLRWVLGFGANIKVIQPQALVDKVQDMSRAIAQVYSKATS